MFDIGFAELLIIGVVALIVIGPERLPEAVRTASAWINRFRRSFNDIKQEVQQELHNDAVLRDLRESGQKLQQETDRLRREFSGAEADSAPPSSGAFRTEEGDAGTGSAGGDVAPTAPAPSGSDVAGDVSADSVADSHADSHADSNVDKATIPDGSGDDDQRAGSAAGRPPNRD
jgi:sec-independent protein translocase protein TatB